MMVYKTNKNLRNRIITNNSVLHQQLLFNIKLLILNAIKYLFNIKI